MGLGWISGGRKRYFPGIELGEGSEGRGAVDGSSSDNRAHTEQSRGIRASHENGWKYVSCKKHLESLVTSTADRELSTDP